MNIKQPDKSKSIQDSRDNACDTTRLLDSETAPKGYYATGKAQDGSLSEENNKNVMEGPISPEIHANLLQHWTLWWLNDIFRLGYKRPIQEQDLYQMLDNRQAHILGQQLNDNWEHVKRDASIKKKNPSLLKAIIISFIRDSQTMDPPPAAIKGYGLAALAFTMSVTQLLLYQRWSVCSFKTGLFIRTALIDVVFRKATTISAKARLLYPDGSIINLMSTDISRIDKAMVPLLIAVASPLYILVIMILLVRLMGPSALLGGIILMFSNPLQGWSLSKLAPIRKQASQFTDSRIRLTTEILQGIKAIKFFAWENNFLSKLAEVRLEELALIRHLLVTRGFITASSGALPVLASATSFVVYAALGNELTPQVVFPALAFYSIMRVPLLILPNCYTTAIDAYVAICRIQEFLLSEDGINDVIADDNAEEAIAIHNGYFFWETLAKTKSPAPSIQVSAADPNSKSKNIDNLVYSAEQNQDFLKDINLKIARGSLVAVIGPVGSGKSSLLQAMVGNMSKSNGKIIRGSTVSYASQVPWIQNATIRDNIVFDTKFDEDRYWRVIKACSLEKDLDSFPGGDMAEIGERGINLSGGQKARLSLARSVYFDAELVIMDDPLSAVDAHVGKRLWKDCVIGEIKDKTRVIATHHLHILPDVDYVVCMRDGKISAQGTYHELLKNDGGFMELMLQYGGLKQESQKPRVDLPPGSSAESSTSVQMRQDSTWDTESDQTSLFDEQAEEDIKKASEALKMISKEEREVGAVNSNIYKEYFKMAGFGMWTAVIFCYILQQVCSVMMNYWLSLWSDQVFDLPVSVNIAVYVSFAIGQFIVVSVASVLLSFTIIKTSKRMHGQAFDMVIHAPMSFFDSNPIGRILNRFSKDIETLDGILWENLNDVFITMLIVLGAGTSVYYRATSREFKRLDSTQRSVLYSYFAESLTGMGTLRAYNRLEHAISVNQQKIDLGNCPYYLFQMGTRWVALRIQIIGLFFVLLTSLFVIEFRNSINTASAGLILSYLVRNAGDMSYTIQCITSLESNMTSVERLVHYSKNLPQEPPAESRPDIKPKVSWPDRGRINFTNVSLRYRSDLPLVLKDVSFDIEAGKKVAVVGRTGAGKSSLIQALFLLCHLEHGQITIDGIDTQTIGTADLRTHIAIIPQDPVLFHGTFRYNLDPLGKYSENELWNVLETSDLKAYVQTQNGGLDAIVSVGGENLSVGQRQLLCLSRALLAKSKIVVLDEATASVDMTTDALIQKAIRVDFAGSTVVTIAHRINTIIDYDRILVMRQGQVIEYDTPRNLLIKEDSTFSELVAETGEQNAAHLRALAGL
ncbi:hypothetical protein BGZ76_004588 [Entomortierella beljakovae]|nr:hypothetical protein BGZ76_004588 [Entomortierella beljakovae]